ncbi:MAG: chemotaxis protein CheX [Bryobacterales bacterium]|nr:chemotaxis protein CheX [Acidobacteriota bacterium]MCB9383134.1 chemotaxis protein CheX [Bryobacterales bacterium]
MAADLTHEATRQEELAASMVHDVFSTMLALEMWPAEEATPPAQYPVLGVVFFAGARKGAVQVELESRLAYRITAHLMSTSTPDEVDSDVCDAVGEVVNMIAGNLKGTLPPDTVMSMPAVVSGRSFSLSIAGATQVDKLDFATPDGRFRVTLVQTHNS